MADDDLPIDVHYDKLIDWLVDRKKVAKDWRKKLAGVHAKLSELARELPGTLTRAHGLGVPDASLVESGTGDPPRWDYFRAVLVRDRIVAGADLRVSDADDEKPASSANDANATDTDERDANDAKETETEKEKSIRGLFGRLTGKAKAWDDVVRAYEKDALHLPECGATMTRATDHETPFRRRENAKLAKQLVDSGRRETELRRSAVAAKEKFASLCADVFGETTIEGRTDDVLSKTPKFPDETPRDEVAFRGLVDGLVARLDSVFDAAVAAARTDAVGEAAEHYARWTEWAHGNLIHPGGGGEKNENDENTFSPSVAVASLTPHLARLRAMSAAEAEALGRVSRTGTIRGADGDVGADPDKSVPSSTNDDASLSLDPSAGGIDWDVLGDAAEVEPPAKVEPPADGVDWDVDVAATEAASAESNGGDERADLSTPVEIDWDVGDIVDVSDADQTSGTGVEATSAPIEIDWDVGDVVVVEDAGAEQKRFDETHREDGEEDGTRRANENDDADASPDDSCRLGRALADREFRACVLDDLLELRAFLSQRAADMSRVSGESAALLSSAPAAIRARSDVHELRRLAAACEAPILALAEDGARRLLLLSASERFRARLASDLLAASRLEAKLLAHADEARERQSETRRALRREARRAEAVAKALGEVKLFAERTISAMYKGRTVHIIGEINNALVV